MTTETFAMIGMGIALLFGCGSMLAVRRVKKQLLEMSEILEDVKNGNGNRRILAETHEMTAPIAYAVNDIVRSYENRLTVYQRAEETNRQLCDERGKTILISSHILSEIALLADDIGIIDHGVLLEEESLEELERKSSRHVQFLVSDTAQAARLLERQFQERHFTIQDDHSLRLHNMKLPVGRVVTAFVENGLEVREAHTCEESLEDYFKRVTGGEGIA